jgi:hypothetical protein
VEAGHEVTALTRHPFDPIIGNSVICEAKNADGSTCGYGVTAPVHVGQPVIDVHDKARASEATCQGCQTCEYGAIWPCPSQSEAKRAEMVLATIRPGDRVSLVGSKIDGTVSAMGFGNVYVVWDNAPLKSISPRRVGERIPFAYPPHVVIRAPQR